ncbi:MAG TPA: hypothetical protein VI278_09075 [Nitrososphaeraceae archaeon]
MLNPYKKYCAGKYEQICKALTIGGRLFLRILGIKPARVMKENKPLLNQVNYVLLHLHLAGKHDAKPTHEELRNWLHNGELDVLRMTAK